jgi:exodeoxyribonuclease VII large subunit
MPLATEPGYPPAGGSAKEVPTRESARPTDSSPLAAERDHLTGSPQAPKAFTVAEVVSRIKLLIERQFPAPLWIEGEISNCSTPASGHIYFSLVDERVTDRLGQRLLLPCAFFRNANQHLKFKLEDGMKALCFGDVSTYEAKGQYQLRVLRVQVKGKGDLLVAFEQLKKRLAAEGLFDEARKKSIPRLPERVGVITSRTGSAIHDIVSKLRGWFHVIVLPVKVQGEGAAQEIVTALEWANAQRAADVLIVGRGGGSVEDLWAFNEEPLARAIARSRIPVISAVGHQDDWTIADYVADRRASTPTDAAKFLVQDQQALAEQAHELTQQLLDAMSAFLDDQTSTVEHLHDRLRLLHPAHQLKEYAQRTLQAEARLIQSMRHMVEGARQELEALAGRLEALSPLAVLGRGYSITFRLPDRHVVTDAKTLRVGSELETQLAHGRVVSTVAQTQPESHAADS